MTTTKVMIAFDCEFCGKHMEVYRGNTEKDKPRFCSKRCLGKSVYAQIKESPELKSLREWNERLGETLRRLTMNDAATGRPRGIVNTTDGGRVDEETIQTYLQWEAEFHPARAKRR